MVTHSGSLWLQVPVTRITAGAPRVLNTELAARVKAWHTDPVRPFQFLRFVHARDPVPSVGPQAWGFDHGVLPIWLHKGLSHLHRIYYAPTEADVRQDTQADRPFYMTGMVSFATLHMHSTLPCCGSQPCNSEN